MNYTFNNSSIVSVNSGTIVLNISGKTRTFADAKLVSAVDGKIVLDLPKHAKENGSYLVIGIDDKIDRIFIVHQYRDYCIDYHVSQRHGTITYNQYWTDSSSIRNATPEEIQELNDQLAAEGKRWNPETMQIEKLRWKPVTGQTYYYVALEVIPYISFHIWRDDGVDDQHYQSKNCFKTEEEAMIVMEKLKKLLLEI
jgi:hypothetical protein